MLPFLIIVLILVASVIGEFMFGSLSNQETGKHSATTNRLRDRKAQSYIPFNTRGRGKIPRPLAFFFFFL